MTPNVFLVGQCHLRLATCKLDYFNFSVNKPTKVKFGQFYTMNGYSK